MGIEVSFDKNNQYIQFKGELICTTVMEVLNQFTREAQNMAKWVIDLSKVSRVDSTSVALLIELKRNASEAGKPVSFISLPQSILTIARLSQVESLLVDQ